MARRWAPPAWPRRASPRRRVQPRRPTPPTTVLGRDGAAERAAWVALGDPHRRAGAHPPRRRHAEAIDAGRAGGWRQPRAGHPPRGDRPPARRPGAVAGSCRPPTPPRAAPARACLDLARRAIAQAVDPASPDAMNFTTGGQPLVDAAFLAHAIVRAPAGARRRPRRDDAHPARRRAHLDAGDHAGLQQLAAVHGDGRSGPGPARRAVGSDARRLRAAAARAVVRRRRPLRRRARLPLGLLQQLRHPADAARRARRGRRRAARRGRRCGRRCWPGPGATPPSRSA